MVVADGLILHLVSASETDTSAAATAAPHSAHASAALSVAVGSGSGSGLPAADSGRRASSLTVRSGLSVSRVGRYGVATATLARYSRRSVGYGGIASAL